MALLNVFKKRKEKLASQAKQAETEQVELEKKIKDQPSEKRTQLLHLRLVLESPHITEKATELTKHNQYVFRVLPRANKVEVKKDVENLYGVDVVDVKIINVPRKRRRLGRFLGWRKGYKKAIVKIKEGQKIEVLPR
jgi:large subunit ribosomal protein L23